MAIEFTSFERKLFDGAQVNPERKYWFVRSNSGSYYDIFMEMGYVAVDFDQIPFSKVIELRSRFRDDFDKMLPELKSQLKLVLPDYSNRDISILAGQTIRFHSEMNPGDVIITPSAGSYQLSFGVVQTDVYDAQAKDLYECDFKRRRGVKWLKTVSRFELDPYLLRTLIQQKTISDISIHATIIERTLTNFFVQDNEANMVLNIEKSQDIDLEHFVNLFKAVDLANNFIKMQGEDNTDNLIFVKTALNSKGRLQFVSKSIKNLAIVAIIFNSIAGGGLTIEQGDFKLDMSTRGIIKAVEEYKNAEENRAVVEKIRESMDTLQVKSPDDIVKILNNLPTSNK